ncbi:DUF6703 family protein [Actinomadura parmotrematis]|uniref:Uncharacterized protein n=1 Tax=Actinomadura parmotrematis TaxID=2864039 RepID=A0ABS7FSX9_9ACTN|nr:DUF6703 family protein [Actinomadura parmotrematis]MBW8483512.1 hypothetical protein [Actinomadura parmotrematis]
MDRERDSPALRARVERWSAVPLVLLHRRSGLLIAAVVVLLVAGLLVPGPAGAVSLAVLLALLGWLTYLNWPGLDARARTLRAAALLVLAGLAAVHALGWF